MERFRGRPAQRPRHCSVPAESPPGVLAQCGLCPRRHFTGSQGGGGTDQSPRGTCWRTSSLRWGTPGAALPPPAGASRMATSSLQSGPGQQCLLARGVALCRTVRSAAQRSRAVATCTARARLFLHHTPRSGVRCQAPGVGALRQVAREHFQVSRAPSRRLEFYPALAPNV